VSSVHILADLTLGLGKVVHDYLAAQSRHARVRTSRFSVDQRELAAAESA